MLDVRRLAVLRAFADAGSIAAAADALAFTPSAVSQQLAQLQREAGVTLLRKAGRRLELTDAGAMLATRAGELLARLEETEAELAAQAGEVAGSVRVAAFQTAARQLVIPALDVLAEAHPRLRVELVESEAEESLPMLERGAVSVAIAEEYEHAPRPRSPRLHRYALEPDELLLGLPPALAGRFGDEVELRALRDVTWATIGYETTYNDMFERLCRAAGGFEPIVGHRVHDMGLLLELVARGRAVALLPALGRPRDDPRIALRRLAEAPARSIFVAVRTVDRSRPSVVAVVDALASMTAG